MNDYYTFSPFNDSCYVIEGKNGELLIGDNFPSTPEAAALLCRVANIA